MTQNQERRREMVKSLFLFIHSLSGEALKALESPIVSGVNTPLAFNNIGLDLTNATACLMNIIRQTEQEPIFTIDKEALKEAFKEKERRT